MHNLLLAALLLLAGTRAQGQQNQKIIFPKPAAFSTSNGESLIPTSDGGFLLVGSVSNFTAGSSRIQPRLIKLNASLQTEWDSVYLNPLPGRNAYSYPSGDAVELPDGDFAIGLNNDSNLVGNVEVLRLNADGSVQFAKALPGNSSAHRVMDVLPNGNLVVFSFEFSNTSTAVIRHLGANGDIVYTKTLPAPSFNYYGGEVILLENGDLLFGRYNGLLQKTIFVRTDNQGNTVWESPPSTNYQTGFFALPNGGFGTFFDSTGQTSRARLFNSNGVETAMTPIFPIRGRPSRVRAYPDGSLFISGQTQSQRGYMTRMAMDGSTVWAVESPEDGQAHLKNLSGIPTTDGWGVSVGATVDNHFGFLRASANTGIFINTLSGRLAKDDNDNCTVDSNEPGVHLAGITASQGNETFYTHSNQAGLYTLYLPHGAFDLSVQTNELFFDLCPAAPTNVVFLPNAASSQTLNLPLQTADLIHTLRGKLVFDQNGDCMTDGSEPPLENWNLVLSKGNQQQYLKTNQQGEYQIFVAAGNYTLRAFPWNSKFGICGQADRQINLASNTPEVVTEDFVGFSKVNCPQMSVNMSGWNIRPCSTSLIQVFYQNEGTIVAPNAQLKILLDPALALVSAVPPPNSITGNSLTFDLGNILPSPGNAAQSIQLSVRGDCALQIGQQVCVTAAITPNDPCTAVWSGAVIEVDDECLGDSAVFRIRNIGAGGQDAPLGFVIVEDQIVLRQGTFNLPPGDEQIEKVRIANSASTVAIIADQEPGAPGDSLVSFSLTNCIGLGGGSPGGNGGNSSPFMAQQCLQVVNSYDPNDKNATPLGYGPNHVVRPGTPLQYTIRFQNTGNDTAFLVILRDTLSAKLDFSRIEALGSSHAYQFSQVNDSILHIRFDNIRLPDSSANPIGSQGFIHFRIYPKPGLPLGTPVGNRAAIYFDQNPPVLTNTVWRTYGEYLIVETENPGPGSVQVQVAPNPFVRETTFRLPDTAPAGNYRLEVFNALGQRVQTVDFVDKTCTLHRGGLPNGAFFWHILQEEKRVANGRVVKGE